MTPRSLPAATLLLGAVLALLAAAPFAQEGRGLSMRAPANGLVQTDQDEGGPALRIPKSSLAQANDSAVTRQSENPSRSGPGRPKSYALPAMETVGFDTLLGSERFGAVDWR